MKLILPLFLLFVVHHVFGQQSDRSTIAVRLENTLPESISESSGLIYWNDALWTHNDSGDHNLYKLDAGTAQIVGVFRIPSERRHDWEELAQDSLYLYLADTGNNARNRNRVFIHRIKKSGLERDSVVSDVITIKWPVAKKDNDQENTNYDCEAMVVSNDSIWLFTKEWKGRGHSRMFVVPALPGEYVPEERVHLRTRMLVTSSVYQREKRRLVLCGYSKSLKPQILVYDNVEASMNNISNPKRYRLGMKRNQVEAIAGMGETDFVISSERLQLPFLRRQANIWRFSIPQ